jgi:endonuclease/exonuclease/phosphatase family metal-dependent hydrolase
MNAQKETKKIIIGDLNAKIGQEEIFKLIIEKYSLHNISNDNGIRAIDFASTHNMVIGSTMFNHRNIHEITWKSPDDSTFNQIDHLIIDVRHVSNLLDVRSSRGANIDSDHYLVIPKIRGRICNMRKICGYQVKNSVLEN